MKEKYTITVDLYQSTVAELLSHYRRFKELSEQAGNSVLSAYTFEDYIEHVLTLGCKHFMLKNAEFTEINLEHCVANQKGRDTNG